MDGPRWIWNLLFAGFRYRVFRYGAWLGADQLTRKSKCAECDLSEFYRLYGLLHYLDDTQRLRREAEHQDSLYGAVSVQSAALAGFENSFGSRLFRQRKPSAARSAEPESRGSRNGRKRGLAIALQLSRNHSGHARREQRQLQFAQLESNPAVDGRFDL